ncbi:MAG: methionyl-tRNA formyltransferase [Bacteroidetes bacterium]|nr:methionyl-tRNA formyltransferase [Bacteroidota bacterium]MBS1740782.1 methionyl-tRNA formyltransferase [Bacteroidota bacterium]
MGTPLFAVASLQALIDAGAQIVGVVTSPDKPAGRGMHIHKSAVKEYAEAQNLNLLQPEKLKSTEFLSILKNLRADLQVVVAFRMLPEVVWNMPPMGTINVHASLLPQYRGAAPINWAIINGERETGVTTFKLKHEIDTGDILLQRKIEITQDDNAGTIHDKLMLSGANLLIDTIAGLANNSIPETPQSKVDIQSLKHAPKIFKDNLFVDWNKTANEIINLIRGLAPYPSAHAMLQGKQIKIFKAHAEYGTTKVLTGTIETDHKHYLRIAAADGWVYLDHIQMEGKKQMPIEDFLRGFRLIA